MTELRRPGAPADGAPLTPSEPHDAAKGGPWAHGPERVLLKHGLVTLDQLEWAAKQRGG
jgi:hypothetical protein